MCLKLKKKKKKKVKNSHTPTDKWIKEVFTYLTTDHLRFPCPCVFQTSFWYLQLDYLASACIAAELAKISAHVETLPQCVLASRRPNELDRKAQRYYNTAYRNRWNLQWEQNKISILMDLACKSRNAEIENWNH